MEYFVVPYIYCISNLNFCAVWMKLEWVRIVVSLSPHQMSREASAHLLAKDIYLYVTSVDVWVCV